MAGDLITFTLLSLSSLLVIVNPFTATLTFVSISPALSSSQQLQVASEASRYAFLILMGFAILGGFIFQLFGITLEAFRIAGGILLFFIGMEMVTARPSRTKVTATEQAESIEAEDISMIPLAFPMISGPGAITTTIVLMNEAQGSLAEIAVILISIAVTMAITYLMLRHSEWIVERIGQTDTG